MENFHKLAIFLFSIKTNVLVPTKQNKKSSMYVVFINKHPNEAKLWYYDTSYLSFRNIFQLVQNQFITEW